MRKQNRRNRMRHREQTSVHLNWIFTRTVYITVSICRPSFPPRFCRIKVRLVRETGRRDRKQSTADLDLVDSNDLQVVRPRSVRCRRGCVAPLFRFSVVFFFSFWLVFSLAEGEKFLFVPRSIKMNVKSRFVGTKSEVAMLVSVIHQTFASSCVSRNQGETVCFSGWCIALPLHYYYAASRLSVL